MPPGRVREHRKDGLATLHTVDLVQHQDRRCRFPADPAEDAIVVANPARRLDDHQYEVDADQCPRRGPVHGAVEGAPVPRVNAWSVDEDDLRRIAGRDSQDPVAGGLRPVGRDAELLAHHRVDERGLPDVRPPDYGHEPAAVTVFSRRLHREWP